VPAAPGAIWLDSVSPWLILPLFVFVITRIQIIPEKRALGLLFGTEYLAYRRAVGRWLGRLG
jgi:protein-S-isoprenylcysteine O-methyltransferase Ste14